MTLYSYRVGFISSIYATRGSSAYGTLLVVHNDVEWLFLDYTSLVNDYFCCAFGL